MCDQMLQLQLKMEAALAHMQKHLNPQVINIELLLCTAAKVYNIANPFHSQHSEPSSDVSTKLYIIRHILNSNLTYIDEDRKKSFYNQNLIHNLIETCQENSEEQFASMKVQLPRFVM